MDAIQVLFIVEGFANIQRYFTSFGTEYVIGTNNDFSYVISDNNGSYTFSINNCIQIVSQDSEVVLSTIRKIIDGELGVKV